MYFLIALTIIVIGLAGLWFGLKAKEKNANKFLPWDDFWSSFSSDEQNVILLYYTEESLKEERFTSKVKGEKLFTNDISILQGKNEKLKKKLRELLEKHHKLNQVIKALPEKNIIAFRTIHPSYKVFVKHQELPSFYSELENISSGISTAFEQVNDYETNLKWLTFAFTHETLKEFQTEITQIINWVENQHRNSKFQSRLGLAMGNKNDINALENFLDSVLDHDEYAIFLSLMALETDESREKLIEILEDPNQTVEQVNLWAKNLEHQKEHLAPMLILKMLSWAENKKDFEIANYTKAMQCLGVWNWSSIEALEACTKNKNAMIRQSTIRLFVYQNPNKITNYFEQERENLIPILEIIPEQKHWQVLSLIYPKLEICNLQELNYLTQWVKNATEPSLIDSICSACASHAIQRKINITTFYICRTCESPINLSTEYQKIGAYIGKKPENEKDILWIHSWLPETRSVKYVEADILSLDVMDSSVDYDRMVNELINILHNQHPKNPLTLEVRISPALTFDDNTLRLLNELRA